MPLLETLRQFDISLADFFSMFAATCLVCSLLLAALCGPLSAFALECAGAARRKAFYDKCAMQAAQLAFLLTFALYAALGVTLFTLINARQPELLAPPHLRRVLVLAAVPLGHFVLLGLYLLLWAPLRKLRALHLLLGLFAALASAALLFTAYLGAAYASLLPFALNDPPRVFLSMLNLFLSEPPQWLFLSYACACGFALAGALCLLWLLARRNRADFGRDYYTFAMRAMSRQALIFTLVSSGLAGWLVLRMQESALSPLGQAWEPALLLPAFGLPLVCCLLWFLVIRSQTPMRHKPGVFFAGVFLFVAFCAQALGFLNALPQP